MQQNPFQKLTASLLLKNFTHLIEPEVVLPLMYVCPCIIYENDERYQLDATIVIYYHKYLYMFRVYSWRWTHKCPKHVEIFMIINHNCCIKLEPLVVFVTLFKKACHLCLLRA